MTTDDFAQQAISPLTGEAVSQQQFMREVRAMQDARANQGGKSTVIERDGNTVTISTDEHGNTTITKHAVGMPVPPAAPAPPALPGIGVDLDPDFGSHPFEVPSELVGLGYGFMALCAFLLGWWPMHRRLRRIEKKLAATLSAGSADQLQRIEQAVEAMAIEVERISESQRFITKLQSGSSAERV